MKTLILSAALIPLTAIAAQAYYITEPINDPAIDRLSFNSTGAVNTLITMIASPSCPNGTIVSPATGCITLKFNAATNPLFLGSNAFINPSSTSGAFSQYAMNDDYPLMSIKDLILPFPMTSNITSPSGNGNSTTTDLPLVDWISLGNPQLSGNMTTFTLSSIPDFQFDNLNNNAKFNLEGYGVWKTYTPSGIKTYEGEISIGHTFNGLGTDEVLALASRPEGFKTSFSGTATAFKKGVNEPKMVFGMLATFLSLVGLKRKLV